MSQARSKTSLTTVSKLQSVFQIVESTSAELGSPLNINHMRVLLTIAANEDQEVSKIHSKLGYAESTLSRLIAQLSVYTKGGNRAGAEYIEFVVDPADRRVHRVRLTDSGRAFLNKLEGTI